jgi:hypothetical protein
VRFGSHPTGKQERYAKVAKQKSNGKSEILRFWLRQNDVDWMEVV